MGLRTSGGVLDGRRLALRDLANMPTAVWVSTATERSTRERKKSSLVETPEAAPASPTPFGRVTGGDRWSDRWCTMTDPHLLEHLRVGWALQVGEIGMLFGEEMLDPTGAGERHHVHRLVSCTGEGMGSPARDPSEASCFRRPACFVELDLQSARDNEEPLVHGIVPVENRARGPAGKHELADTDRTTGVVGQNLEREHRVLETRLPGGDQVGRRQLGHGAYRRRGTHLLARGL